MDNLCVVTGVKALVVRSHQCHHAIVDIYIPADVGIGINMLDTEQLGRATRLAAADMRPSDDEPLYYSLNLLGERPHAPASKYGHGSTRRGAARDGPVGNFSHV